MDNFLFREIVVEAAKLGASDIHISTGSAVKVRTHGRLIPTNILPSRSEIEDIINTILKTEGAITKLYDLEEYDLSTSVVTREGVLRFRVNISLFKEGVYIVMRRLSYVEPDPSLLGVPEKFLEIVNTVPYGLIFIAGPTGSGKTTTLASVIGSLAINTDQNIITIEDPIECEILPGKNSNVIQREVGRHTQSFAKAIRAAMRQDPDTILVGEVRDPETAIAAMQAAKTGHLVFTTIHTDKTTQIPGRITSMFEADKQPWIMNELMESMVAGMVQKLVPSVDGKRVLCTEFFDCVSSDTRDAIRNGKIQELRNELIKGINGWTLASSLARNVKEGKVSLEMAEGYANDLDELKNETLLITKNKNEEIIDSRVAE